MKTKRKITCEQARSICIILTLKRLGHFPNRKTEKEAWFLSPLRTETQASFKVSLPFNRWYDFGIGKGGNVIDLVGLIFNCSVAETLSYLSEGLPVLSSNPDHEIIRHKNSDKNIFLKNRPVEHDLLKKYLRSREIPVCIARQYCREIWYECNGKIFFALGLQNHLGGWELRNQYCKTSTVPKTYTYIKKGGQELIVIEGMFDLLSLAVISSEEVEKADLLILNSLAFIPKVLQLLQNYTTVKLFLDRDSSGRKATAEIQKSLSHCVDGSSMYDGYKDLNEKLLKRTT